MGVKKRNLVLIILLKFGLLFLEKRILLGPLSFNVTPSSPKNQGPQKKESFASLLHSISARCRGGGILLFSLNSLKPYKMRKVSDPTYLNADYPMP